MRYQTDRDGYYRERRRCAARHRVANAYVAGDGALLGSRGHLGGRPNAKQPYIPNYAESKTNWLGVESEE
jgi:hypothetical protein